MSSDPSEWTIGRLLEWTSRRLAESGVSEARLEAEMMLAKAIGGRRIDLYAQHGRNATDDERSRFRDMVRRRLEHEPVAYIIGKREFYALEFKVDSRVLVPRHETELVVDEARACLRGHALPLVVDVGTGSGAILLSVLSQIPSARGIGIDLSGAAIEVADDNARSLGMCGRVEWVKGSLLELLPGGITPHAITANLPYIPGGEIDLLSHEVRREPRIALDGGPDGLSLVRALAEQSEAVLPPGGHLILEVGAGQGEAVSRWLSDRGWRVKPAIRDGGGHWRVVSASRP